MLVVLPRLRKPPSGDVESTEPTKCLMRIAEYIDTCDQSGELRVWFAENKREVLDMLSTEVGRVERIKERARTVDPVRCGVWRGMGGEGEDGGPCEVCVCGGGWVEGTRRGRGR